MTPGQLTYLAEKKEFYLPSFWSSSVDLREAWKYAKKWAPTPKHTVIRFYKPKTPRYLGSLSMFGYEKEVLFNAGTHFKVRTLTAVDSSQELEAAWLTAPVPQVIDYNKEDGKKYFLIELEEIP